jgi:hypothetical protein
MCRATGSGADPKEDPEIDRLADTHLPHMTEQSATQIRVVGGMVRIIRRDGEE